MVDDDIVAVAPCPAVAGAGPHIDDRPGGGGADGGIGGGGEIHAGVVVGVIEAPAVVAADVSIALDGIDKPGAAVIHLAAAARGGGVNGVDIRLDLLHFLFHGGLVGQIFLLQLFDVLKGAFHLGLLAGQAGLFAFGGHLGIGQVLLFRLHLRLQRAQLLDVIGERLQKGAVMLRNAA